MAMRTTRCGDAIGAVSLRHGYFQDAALPDIAYQSCMSDVLAAMSQCHLLRVLWTQDPMQRLMCDGYS
jgi:hypothetical protein